MSRSPLLDRAPILEFDAHAHVMRFERTHVEHLVRRGEARLRQLPPGRCPEALARLVRYLRCRLAEPGTAFYVTVSGPANFFAFLAREVGDWRTGYEIGRALELPEGDA